MPLKSYFKNIKIKKKISKELYLLDDYIFCYHSKFNRNQNFNLIKFSRGLKNIFLDSAFYQKEIKDFINKCKNSENNEGYISEEFYGYKLNINYKFIAGFLSGKLFKIIEIQKNKLKILLDDHKVLINKKELLYQPV